jgi:hypothetical protein
LLPSTANALEGQKKKAVSLLDETSKNQANNGHLPNVEETFPTLAEFDGINSAGLIGLDDFDFRNASSLDMMISGALSSLDAFSGSADSGSLFSYEHQSFSDLNPGWQYTTRLTTRSTNPPSLSSQETDELTSWPPRNKSALPSTILPSPYRNHIRLNRLCLYAACYENVVQMGISIEIAETPRCPSPFYQSPSSSSQEPTSISHQISKRCEERLTPDLRPSTIQRTHAHEIYLDVYPFPKWRDKVIQLLSLSPPAFDEMELKKDLDKDGLICWGSMSGKGSGAPWDSRSWEAQKWFLDKWWFLTKDSGVDTQSEWWRMMRGDNDNDDEHGVV